MGSQFSFLFSSLLFLHILFPQLSFASLALSPLPQRIEADQTSPHNYPDLKTSNPPRLEASKPRGASAGCAKRKQ